jgi:rod shape-determining protein MreD
MRALLVFLVLLAAAIVQTTVGPALGLWGSAPNGVLVLVVCWGLVRGSEEGMAWGVLGGLAVGLLSGAPLGAHSLVLAVIGFLAGLGQSSPFGSRLFVSLVAVGAATVLEAVGMALILRVSGWPIVLSPALTGVVVPAMIVNAVLTPFCYWLIAHLFELRGGLRPEF